MNKILLSLTLRGGTHGQQDEERAESEESHRVVQSYREHQPIQVDQKHIIGGSKKDE